MAHRLKNKGRIGNAMVLLTIKQPMESDQ